MCVSRALVSLLPLPLILISLHGALVSAEGDRAASKWQTLNGQQPLVVSENGFSGLFPACSETAYQFVNSTSLDDILWCDVQLTQDAYGVCFRDLILNNASNIDQIFPNGQKNYSVNGVSTQGWFSVDFTFNDLTNVTLMQPDYSRLQAFDFTDGIMTVQNVYENFRPKGFWLNIPFDTFYTQHNLSMRSFVISVSKKVIVNYISSPEVGFLRSIVARFQSSTTKLVFQFLGRDDVEPSTKMTYGVLLRNLTFIKTFASGIMVPKSYIYPVDQKNYLLTHTSLVSDAHKAGLLVFASDFANDNVLSYNYSYDPVSEYLNFIDNGAFSVDGVLSSFPITPSEAIACFAHMGKNASGQAKPLIISNHGASGDYPACTDLAYKKAISDGADVIDCAVQISQDGIPFCFLSINLMDGTTIARSSFSNLARSFPEIQQGTGIFCFSLNWSDIQTLHPAIQNPYTNYSFYRNPAYQNAGKLLTLSDFLALTKNTSSLSGILISIKHAAYLAEKQGLGVTDAVLDALSKAGYDKGRTQKVMIQSADSSVLKYVKKKADYDLVYEIDKAIGDALKESIEEIKEFANAVVIDKTSVFPTSDLFLTGSTNVVDKLQLAKVSVYVGVFRNEFVSQAWDFLSDATVEINSFVQGTSIDGVITEFPATAVRYKKNRCLSQNPLPVYMSAIPPGGLLDLLASVKPAALPPAEPPNPALTEADLTEPPLPPVAVPTQGNTSTATAPTAAGGQPRATACAILSLVTVLAAALLFA